MLYDKVLLESFLYVNNIRTFFLASKIKIAVSISLESASESWSVVSDSLWPLGIYSPWNSPGQNTGEGSLSLPQGIFPTQGLNPVCCIAGGFFTSWATKEAQEYWSSLFCLQRIFPTQESDWGLLHCRRILYQLSYQGSPKLIWSQALLPWRHPSLRNWSFPLLESQPQ